MKAKINFWKDSEVKSLFKTVETGKQCGKSLSKLFEQHSNQFGRKPNSVRNYYYREVEEMTKNSQRAENLDIDLSKHSINVFNKFSEDDGKKLVENVEQLVERGYSVRKACLKLANNDVTKMVRIQNKYRSIIKKTMPQNITLPNNITKIPSKKAYLTEKDLNCLFTGLVKIVKKNAIEEFERTTEFKREQANALFRRTLAALNERDKEIKRMRAMFKMLEFERNNMKEELTTLKCETAQILTEAGKKKIERLEKYFSDKTKGKSFSEQLIDKL